MSHYPALPFPDPEPPAGAEVPVDRDGAPVTMRVAHLPDGRMWVVRVLPMEDGLYMVSSVDARIIDDLPRYELHAEVIEDGIAAAVARANGYMTDDTLPPEARAAFAGQEFHLPDLGDPGALDHLFGL